MDSKNDPDIIVVDGLCNHCRTFRNFFGLRTNYLPVKEIRRLIKSSNKNTDVSEQYDCIVGISGGFDSSLILKLLCEDLLLRPLAVHVDNGWNSATAVDNIRAMCDRFNVDLIVSVLEWASFKKTQLAFIECDLPDVDVCFDHAIMAELIKHSKKYETPNIISGMNYRTEGIVVPAWSYGHIDSLYLKSVYKYIYRESYPLPSFSLFDLGLFHLRGGRFINLLNLFDFSKDEEFKKMTKIGWKPPSSKHGESVFTDFLQRKYLKLKFGFEKIKGHQSDLIRCGELSRDCALKAAMDYNHITAVKEKIGEFKYVERRYELRDGWDRSVPVNRERFRSNRLLVSVLKKIVNWLRSKELFPK